MADDIMQTRLEAVRRQMHRMGVDAVIVRSTDRFLNEYVPTDESARVWITGFTGSMGEVLITLDAAYLAVDGRYWLQAEAEVDPKLWTLIKVQMGTGLDQAITDALVQAVEAAKPKKLRVGFEPERITLSTLERLQKAVGAGCTWKALFPSPVEQARGADRPPARDPGIRAVDQARVGATVREKLAALAPKLTAAGADALLVQRLDDIAYLSNLRGSELPYQATFKSIALATPETLFVGIDPAKVPNAVRKCRDDVLFVPEAELWTLMGKKAKRKAVALDPSENTEQARLQIEQTGAEVVLTASPLAPLKAKKNPAELAVMQEAFHRADHAVAEAIQWACKEVVAGKKVSERTFADQVSERFSAHGAVGLSFAIISAAGKNGAIIHYSDPSPRRLLKEGELMLLDTGAYFEEGYATDLTRTFLVGGPKQVATEEQQRIYTLVLKAAMAGMRATFPVGTTGAAIDALVRAPLWAEGLDYNHGTGHGVGVNVHEFPPRLNPASRTALEVGHVFSIEPGLYLPKFGGVRIENLCTVEPLPGAEGFLRVKPLTFSPLDKRLIDVRRLDPGEKAWLAAYAKQHRPLRAAA
jgi:Xaa-Pro aminopeptidase